MRNTNHESEIISSRELSAITVLDTQSPEFASGVLQDVFLATSATATTPSSTNRTLFIANNGIDGRALWITDGTEAGTWMVKDFRTDGVDPSIYTYAALGNQVFFTVNDGIRGNELWVTDGTDAGTYILKDINPGTAGSSPQTPYVHQGKLLFSAYDGTSTRLYISDGTAEGTGVLSSGIGGYATAFRPVGDKLVFSASNGLWTTDGTAAGTVQLINTSSSFYNGFTALGSKLLFNHTTASGEEPWVTDGTMAGTFQLKDVNPGTGSSYAREYVIFGTKALFVASNPTSGTEVWITDGTSAGTVLLKDIRVGAEPSYPGEFLVSGSRVFFTADNGVNGHELWVTNGTAAGTVMLKDIQPGANTGQPHNLIQVGTKVVFTAYESTYGHELWVTDGTAAGTVLLKNINATATTYPNSSPTLFKSFGNKALFSANDGIHGFELWITDGTIAGTVMLKDLNPGDYPDAQYSDMAAFTQVGNRMIIPTQTSGGNWTLWSTDGTADGTVELMTAVRLNNQNGAPTFTVMGDQLVFGATDGVEGPELWVTDGTVAGTHQIDLNDTENLGSNWNSFGQIDGQHLINIRSNGGNSSELWSTDGTPEGTTKVFPFVGGVSGTGFAMPTGGILFSAAAESSNYELWFTDGTTAGTRLVKDIVPGPNYSQPSQFGAFGDFVLFMVRDPSTSEYLSELWVTDGTEAGTVRVGSQLDRDYHVINGKIVFSAKDAASGSELWVSDGTAAGTALLKDINPGTASSTPYSFIEYGDKLAFIANSAAHGSEMWITDGTAAGTMLLLDGYVGPQGSAPSAARIFGDKFVFDGYTTENNVSFTKIWVSDGTPAGTQVLAQFNYFGAHNLIANAFEFNGKLFFGGSDVASGEEPWVTDGTAQGTFRLADAYVGSRGSSPNDYALAGDRLIFLADSNGQTGLWSTDGTAAGTIKLTTIFRSHNSTPYDGGAFTALGEKQYFTSNNSGGYELWVTDGTLAGTMKVKDINPTGDALYSQSKLFVFQDKFYFSANDGTGNEVWVSDGTSAGTYKLKDINALSQGGNPFNFYAIGDHLYFSANDGVLGHEVWVTDGTAEGTHMVRDFNTNGVGSDPRGFFNFSFDPEPINTVPVVQVGTEDEPIVFSSGNTNSIKVSNAGILTVTLSVESGTLTLARTDGLTFSAGANGSGMMTISGYATRINEALDGLVYQGALNFEGTDTLTISTSRSTFSDTDSVSITLADDGRINGDSANNTLTGTPAGDTFMLQDGGADSAYGLAGTDGFYFGAAYTSADTVDGGAGTLDQIGLQGDYSAGVTLGSLTGVELLAMLSGTDTRFGDTAGNLYDYNITATDGSVASGKTLILQGNTLEVGEDFTFNGSAETDGSFTVYGGYGVDNFTGGSGAAGDGFFFGEGRFGSGDVINGGGSNLDQLGLQGKFTGTNALTFGAGQLIGVEYTVLLSAADNRFGASGGTVAYDLTTNDGNVAAGQRMIISGNTLKAGEGLTFNGSAEIDGKFQIFSGAGDDFIIGSENGDEIFGAAGNDVLTGGAGDDLIVGGLRGDTLTGGTGNDIFRYNVVEDSNSTERDGIQDFNNGDRIDLSRIDANVLRAGNQAFSFIGNAAFGGSAGELRYENISLGGPIWIVQGDNDGNGVSDFEVVLVISPADPITASDFFL